MDTFGNRLKSLRKTKNLTQEELAKLLNVAKGTVSNWENENRFPDKDMLNKIADTFKVSMDYLLGRTNEEKLTIATPNITKKDIKDHNTFMEDAKALFMNDDVAEEDLEKIYRDISELYWEAKEINKKKYGKKK